MVKKKSKNQSKKNPKQTPEVGKKPVGVFGAAGTVFRGPLAGGEDPPIGTPILSVS